VAVLCARYGGFLRARSKLYPRHSQNDFVGEQMRYDATVRNIELIGEAATHVPASVRQAATNIPWRMLIATV
jgi:uncharacterized protein with HEPN domain